MATFPGGIGIRRAGPRPVEQPTGNVYGDIGQGLRQTSGDIERFGMMQDMIKKRQLSQRVAAAKAEMDQRDFEFREAEQLARQEKAERDKTQFDQRSALEKEKRERQGKFFDRVSGLDPKSETYKDDVRRALFEHQQVDPSDIYRSQFGGQPSPAKGQVKESGGFLHFVNTVTGESRLLVDEKGNPLPIQAKAKIVETPDKIVLVDPITKEVTDIGLEPKGAREEKRKEEKWELDKRKALQKHKTTKLKHADTLEGIGRFAKKLMTAANSKSLKWVTGLGGVLPIVPGTGQADLNGLLNELVALGTLETLGKLKTQSSTGASGFGALSGPELTILQNASLAISDRNITPKRMKQVLTEAARVILKYEKRLKKFEAEFQSELQAAPSGDMGSILDDILGPRK